MTGGESVWWHSCDERYWAALNINVQRKGKSYQRQAERSGQINANRKGCTGDLRRLCHQTDSPFIKTRQVAV